MISNNQLQELANFSPQSSWAVWNPNDITDLGPIEPFHGNLKSDVVMVWLNVSKQIDQAWQNYHVGRNDYKLMKAFNDTSYRGAYMTDLIKDHPEASSQKAVNNLSYEVLLNNFDTFYKEMELWGHPIYPFYTLGK